MKLTKPQKEIINILSQGSNKLGDIRDKYYSNKPAAKRNNMRRNSQMSSWLNKLNDIGLVNISWSGDVTYKPSKKALDLLELV